MQINITVSEVDLTSVIGEWRRYDAEGDYVDTGPKTLGDAVAAEIAADLKRDSEYPGLRKRVMAIRDEEIRKLVADQLAKAMTEPIQRTNSYGEPQGETTTLRELIAAEARKFFTEKKGDYRNPKTAAQDVIADEVGRALTQELVKAVADEKAKVVAAVRAKAAELIATAVKEGIGR